MKKNIIYDEQGIHPNTKYKKEQWKEIAVHSDAEIKGFFGPYRFLSNFWKARVFLDGIEYTSVENAYQAAKYTPEKRKYFITCSPKEAVIYSGENTPDLYSIEDWDNIKVQVMKSLLVQKFDKELNPSISQDLFNTGQKYLEESNYWEDDFWGVHKTSSTEKGSGKNNLGKLLMDIRS